MSDGSSSPSLAGELWAATGVNVATCYQCGKCSAGCPMAGEMPLKPHQMLRLAQLDEREKLLSDPSPWLCLTCETCTARCPNEVDPAVWGRNFPREFDGFQRTSQMQATKYGGSVPFSHLDKDPRLKRIFAGYAFALDYREDRGHAFSLKDRSGQHSRLFPQIQA